ncbi:MAG: hypothetical protein ACYDH4_10880 [Candidatus Cryosericum sp.]
MSRNLGQTCCRFCFGDVVLEEEPRPIVREECGAYDYDSTTQYSHRGALVANAHCEDCEAEYLALVDMSACPGYGTSGYFKRDPDVEFFDLSFRSTFNDEPGAKDLPKYKISRPPVRSPWPTCSTCGERIYLCYGCQCPVVPQSTISSEWAAKVAEVSAGSEDDALLQASRPTGAKVQS